MTSRVRETFVRQARRATQSDKSPSRTTNADLTNGTPSQPLLPHEQDEKVGTTGGVPSQRVQQGARDVKRGLQDTSRAIESDKAYQKLRK